MLIPLALSNSRISFLCLPVSLSLICSDTSSADSLQHLLAKAELLERELSSGAYDARARALYADQVCRPPACRMHTLWRGWRHMNRHWPGGKKSWLQKSSPLPQAQSINTTNQCADRESRGDIIRLVSKGKCGPSPLDYFRSMTYATCSLSVYRSDCGPGGGRHWRCTARQGQGRRRDH